MTNIDYFMQKKQDEFALFQARAKLVIFDDCKYLTDGKEMRCIERSSGVIVGEHYTPQSTCAQNCPPWGACTCTKRDNSYSDDIFLALLN